jgi:predicted dehydrogenase
LRVTGERGWLEIGLYNNHLAGSLADSFDERTLELPPAQMPDVWRALHRDFADSIRSGRPPAVGPADALRAARLIDACYAAKRARPMPQRAPLPGWTW